MNRAHPVSRVVVTSLVAGAVALTVADGWGGAAVVAAATGHAVAQLLCLLFWLLVIALGSAGAYLLTCLTRAVASDRRQYRTTIPTTRRTER